MDATRLPLNGLNQGRQIFSGAVMHCFWAWGQMCTHDVTNLSNKSRQPKHQRCTFLQVGVNNRIDARMSTDA